MKIDNFRNSAYIDRLAYVDLQNIIGGWIQWLKIYILFKFQVNRMKI